jgi:hypothetical protein
MPRLVVSSSAKNSSLARRLEARQTRNRRRRLRRPRRYLSDEQVLAVVTEAEQPGVKCPPLPCPSDSSASTFPGTARPSTRRLQQIGGFDTQRDSQRLDVVESEVDEPGLDLADVRLVKIGELGQALLAQPLRLAKALDVRPENAARRLWVRPIHSDGRTKAGLEIL